MTPLIISNLLFGIAILAYFYFKEIKGEQSDKERLANFFAANVRSIQELTIAHLASLEKLSKSKDDLFQKTLVEYLKHNEKLEKMILPQPVTRRAVQEILNQTPPMVPNDIEKMPEEVDQDELNEVLAKIPINKNTKVAFEGDIPDELPEEIIPDSMSGKLS